MTMMIAPPIASVAPFPIVPMIMIIVMCASRLVISHATVHLFLIDSSSYSKLINDGNEMDNAFGEEHHT